MKCKSKATEPYIHYAYIDLEDFACLGIGSLKYFLDANFGVVVWWHKYTNHVNRAGELLKGPSINDVSGNLPKGEVI